jgi:hypothetical protein
MMLILLLNYATKGHNIAQRSPVTLYPIHFEAIGIRQPVPKARSVIFSPGGA